MLLSFVILKTHVSWHNARTGKSVGTGRVEKCLKVAKTYFAAGGVRVRNAILRRCDREREARLRPAM